MNNNKVEIKCENINTFTGNSFGNFRVGALVVNNGVQVFAGNLKAKNLAKQRAEQRQAQETFRKYEEELEINDYPQQARWKVTSKEALAQISEYSEAGITVRGTYYPPGKDPKEGDRKLYLAIESTNELAVSKARAEFIRLIKE